MKRFTAWVGGAAWGFVAYRFWKRSRQPVAGPAAEGLDDRAEELRAKLAETRASDEPASAEPGEPEESVEERRRRVHEEGRAAIDRMNDG